MGEDRGPSASEIVLLNGARIPAGFGVEHRWVTDRCAIGGMIGTAANAAALRRAGITHVINLQDEFDDAQILSGTGIELRWLGVPESLSPFPEDKVREAIEVAREAQSCRDHRIYVHCMAGRNRTPIFAYAILRATGWSSEAAQERIRRAEPAALLRSEHVAAVERCLSGADAMGSIRPGVQPSGSAGG